MKEEKSKKKRKRLEYRAPTFFTNKKLKEKFDRRWVGKKVVYDKYIDLLEIKDNG